jgi:hypothetical protein
VVKSIFLKALVGILRRAIVVKQYPGNHYHYYCLPGYEQGSTKHKTKKRAAFKDAWQYKIPYY